MRCEGCKHYLKGGSACELCYCYDRFEPKDCPPYFDYPKERKPLTHYDRIISKSPEEMAEFIEKLTKGLIVPPGCPKTGCKSEYCQKCWLDYLKQEATDA